MYHKSNPWLALGLKGFQDILLESLIKYTKKKIDISVTLQNLNRHKQLSSNQLEGLKRIFKHQSVNARLVQESPSQQPQAVICNNALVE